MTAPGESLRADMIEERLRKEFNLTESEAILCRMFFDNPQMTNPELAGLYWASVNTIKTHFRHIFRKTEANNRTSLYSVLVEALADET